MVGASGLAGLQGGKLLAVDDVAGLAAQRVISGVESHGALGEGSVGGIGEAEEHLHGPTSGIGRIPVPRVGPFIDVTGHAQVGDVPPPEEEAGASGSRYHIGALMLGRLLTDGKGEFQSRQGHGDVGVAQLVGEGGVVQQVIQGGKLRQPVHAVPVPLAVHLL